jgi:NAD(P)-dependent dehydrogenase (short-subunit alcohol dehydrogenase family)
MSRMTDRVAVITGAASGIGRACALRFSEEGASVVVADLNRDRAAEVVAEIAAAGGAALAVEVDTRSEDACEAMAEAAVDRFGRIDACVAAAGISHAGYVSRAPADQPGRDRYASSDMWALNKSLDSWQQVLDVNLTGVMLTDRAVARHMIEAGGSIVNIASVAAVKALPASADYCVSKAGVWMLTKCLAGELARYGIRVNAVGPGYIQTSMSAAAVANEAWVAARVKETPLRRLGDPVDIANACLYFASDESSFVTGEILFPDGGLAADTRS